MQKNVNLCVDLKTVMQNDAHLIEGQCYNGVLTRETRSCSMASIAHLSTCKMAAIKSICAPSMRLRWQTETPSRSMSIPNSSLRFQ